MLLFVDSQRRPGQFAYPGEAGPSVSETRKCFSLNMT